MTREYHNKRESNQRADLQSKSNVQPHTADDEGTLPAPTPNIDPAIPALTDPADNLRDGLILLARHNAESLHSPSTIRRQVDSVLRMQQTYGNRYTGQMIRRLREQRSHRNFALQREPTGDTSAPQPTVKEPDKFPIYEEWLASFDKLPTFTASDTDTNAPPPPGTNPDLADFGSNGSNLKVFGDKAAAHDPAANADVKATDPTYQPDSTQKLADKFIDHPTDKWVQDNLPDELRATAYQLPADCADVAVILRHVWLFYHGRTEKYGSWIIGAGAGKTIKERQNRIQNVIVGAGSVTSGNLKTIVNAYSDDSGNPIRSFKKLQKLLHPGDVVVWEHQIVDKAGRARRTGGHGQTIIKINRSPDGESILSMEMAQGNEPIGKEEADAIRRGQGKKPDAGRDPLRDTPGRRVEEAVYSGDRLGEFVPGIWSRDDGKDDKTGQQKQTVVVVAGPSGSATRAHGKVGTKTLGKPADWLPVLEKATRDNFEGTFEETLQAARAAIEGGGSLSTQDAQKIGQTAGLRLRELDLQKPALTPEAHLNRVAQISTLLDALARGATQATSMKLVANAFVIINAQFKAAAVRGETVVDDVRRIPVEGLARGNQEEDLDSSKQSAKGRAVVLIPNSVSAKIAKDPKIAVEVLLHLHGKNTGWRKPGSGPARDEAIDKIEQQLKASGRQMVAVLPQGVRDTHKDASAFGSDSYGFDSNDYLDEVFAKLVSMGVWSAAPKVSQVILSAHSGGGFSLTQGGMLGSTHAPSASSGKKLGEVALFDAVNGPKELVALETWLFNQQLPTVLNHLGKLGSVKEQTDFLKGDMRFRAYFTGDPSKAKASPKAAEYAGRHLQLKADIEKWFNDNASGLDAGVLTAFKQNYQVISVDQAGDKRGADEKHNQIMGDGNLKKALGDLP